MVRIADPVAINDVALILIAVAVPMVDVTLIMAQVPIIGRKWVGVTIAALVAHRRMARMVPEQK